MGFQQQETQLLRPVAQLCGQVRGDWYQRIHDRLLLLRTNRSRVSRDLLLITRCWMRFSVAITSRIFKTSHVLAGVFSQWVCQFAWLLYLSATSLRSRRLALCHGSIKLPLFARNAKFEPCLLQAAAREWHLRPLIDQSQSDSLIGLMYLQNLRNEACQHVSRMKSGPRWSTDSSMPSHPLRSNWCQQWNLMPTLECRSKAKA